MSEQTNASGTVKNPNSGRKRKKTTYPIWVTILLFAILVLIVLSIWALFISGPSRIHDEQIAKVRQTIEEQVPGIEHLEQCEFDYVTWTGNTTDTLYWFDTTGQELTTRELSSLDFNGAREKAQNDYGMEAATVRIAYGYSAPVYELENENKILMLDYDTLDWVYERNLTDAPAK